jgi:hypothetical protein
MMKIFSLVGALRQFGMRASILTAIILMGHWFRYRDLDWKDFLFAALMFIAYVILASWLALRNMKKV